MLLNKNSKVINVKYIVKTTEKSADEKLNVKKINVDKINQTSKSTKLLKTIQF